MRSFYRHAFTLIELLVVLAVTAILAAILLPVVSATREQGRAISCMSNMRQIATSVLLYVEDNDERVFFRGGSSRIVMRNNTPNSLPAFKWWNLLMPYLKSNRIFVCPSDASPTLSADANGANVIPRSYIANTAAEDLTLAQIDIPSETMVVTEKTGMIGLPAVPNTSSWIGVFNGEMSDNPDTNGVATPHQAGMNCSLLDGHARWMTMNTVLASRNLSGCVLMHEYPTTTLCDASIPGCASSGSLNICNNFIPY